MEKTTVFWFRRDLRLHDNAGLYHALQQGGPVLPLFIFDRNILDDLSDKQDARVGFIHRELIKIKEELEKTGSSLLIKYGYPEAVWKELLSRYDIAAVYTNHDYEPYAKARDLAVERLLQEKNIPFHTFKDHLIFEKGEILKKDGTPYTVFTPYSRKWLGKLQEVTSLPGEQPGPDTVPEALLPYPSGKFRDNFIQTAPFDLIAPEEMGFRRPDRDQFPDRQLPENLLKHYKENRNFPAREGTSRLSVHFRFGTVSIREMARKAWNLSPVYLNELIWRDFYASILWHFPEVEGRPFRKEYENIEWRNDPEDFRRWCEGRTGYPIVDAGMRELNSTGYMHNRVRMITASFLTKHLLIDWRWGEAYFAEKLLDYDLASNNGGWQWAAGCGTDAAPYFRIFNPTTQQQKFDKDFTYIKEWIPEFGTEDYPAPVVEHKLARERCLRTYKRALNSVK